MSKQDAYDLVTARIIEALEAGIVPWHRPWKTGPANGPRSLSTGKPYQGVNVWVLEATAALRGYESRYWTTFKGAKERGGSVRKGEKGTAIVFWKFIEKTNAEGEKDRIPFLRYFTVFNLDQCDDVAEPTENTTFEPEPFEPIAMAERIAAEMPNRPNVNHGGDRAYYSPMLDYVQMPLQVQFETPSAYYSTLFHELTHSTAHASRLNRKNAVANNFGDESYSREELCAEMGAAFLCGFAGIDVRVSEHASYIGSWLKALKDDRKLVVSAAVAAQKAADYILGALAMEEGSDDSEPSDLCHSLKGGFNDVQAPWYLDEPSPNDGRDAPRPLGYRPHARREKRASLCALPARECQCRGHRRRRVLPLAATRDRLRRDGRGATHVHRRGWRIARL